MDLCLRDNNTINFDTLEVESTINENGRFFIHFSNLNNTKFYSRIMISSEYYQKQGFKVFSFRTERKNIVFSLDFFLSDGYLRKQLCKVKEMLINHRFENKKTSSIMKSVYSTIDNVLIGDNTPSLFIPLISLSLEERMLAIDTLSSINFLEITTQTITKMNNRIVITSIISNLFQIDIKKLYINNVESMVTFIMDARFTDGTKSNHTILYDLFKDNNLSFDKKMLLFGVIENILKII